MWGEGTSRSKSRRRKEGKYERRDDDARVGGGGQNRREWKGRKENRNTRRGMGTIYTKTCEFVKENVNMGERREWNTKVKIGIVVREKCKS